MIIKLKKFLKFFNIEDNKNVIKYFLLLLILAGIYFTFSRATYFAFLITIFIFLYLKYPYHAKLLFFTLIFCLFLYLIFYLSFYSSDIVNYFVKVNLNTGTSIGYRFYMWEKIITSVIKNPFLGSGYLGVSIMEGGSGSAHSQYFDVLFRVGIIGFTIYFITIYKIFKL